LEDVAAYVEGLPFAPPEQMFVLHASAGTLEEGIGRPAAWRHSLFHGNVFRLKKNASTAPGAEISRLKPGATYSTDWAGEQRRLIAELHDAKVERDRANADLAVARHTVAMMETSVFWRARKAWKRVTSLLGGSR